MRLVAVCLAAVLGLGASFSAPDAHAAPAKPKPVRQQPDPRVWAVVKGEDTLVLRFGLPREADPSFAAVCQPAGRLLQFTAEIEGRPFNSGDGVPLTLSSGKRRLELAATAFLGGSGKLVVEAAVALDARVFDLFEAGDTLTLRIPSSVPKAPPVVVTYPLAGARAKLADFQRGCLVR